MKQFISDLGPWVLAAFAAVPAVLAYRRGQKADDRAAENSLLSNTQGDNRDLRRRLAEAERKIDDMERKALNGDAGR